MVAYKPPTEVLLSIGAAFRTVPLLEAARRLVPLVGKDRAALARHGIVPEDLEDLQALIEEIGRLVTDKRTKNKDTPLQMAELIELMAQTRAWLSTLRLLASINLACDTPALLRISSVAPELAEGYPRDLSIELERVLAGARDLRPRLVEVGFSEAFLERGVRLQKQLKTAIGPRDLDANELALPVRRLYMRKAELYLLEKRLVRAGKLAFLDHRPHAAAYHLAEIEPVVTELPSASPPRTTKISRP